MQGHVVVGKGTVEGDGRHKSVVACPIPTTSEHESQGGSPSGRRSGCLMHLVSWMQSCGWSPSTMAVVETRVLLFASSR